MTKTVSEVLNETADLLAKPRAWTQKVLARTPNGASVYPESTVATCWCTLGAMHKNTHRDPLAFMAAFKYLRDRLPSTIPVWNDNPDRTQFEVVKTLRKVAKQAKAEGQ